jgi:multidrug efflux pump subunit AcrA (membrane-fusion protein)
MTVPKLSRPNLLILSLVVATALVAIFLVVKVIAPAYTQPANGTYPSRFGYLNVKRRAGTPFPVETALVGERPMIEAQLGEGRMAAEPVQVPLIPVGKIAAVHVRQGDTVQPGQLLAKMDPSLAQFRLDSAQLELTIAQAEVERVKLGSSYEMALERPKRENINLVAIQKQIALWKEKAASTQKLFEKGIISRTQYQEVQIQLAEAEKELQSSELGVTVSSAGQTHSVAIAESLAREKQFAVQQRARELAECEIRAPAGGIVERVLIHPGEYNQEAGEPAFVIASGLWFEAHLDQMAIHKVKVGDTATVQLEALPSRPLTGKVTAVVPIVTYHSGGPETSRPVRPMGTGAPEWPTTFSARIEFSDEDRAQLVPGLTGFARIEASREVLAVPQSALSSVSASAGLVHVLEAEGLRSVRRVSTGGIREGWVEITDGLVAGEKIIVAGQEDLEPGDRVLEIGATAVTAR